MSSAAATFIFLQSSKPHCGLVQGGRIHRELSCHWLSSLDFKQCHSSATLSVSISLSVSHHVTINKSPTLNMQISVIALITDIWWLCLFAHMLLLALVAFLIFFWDDLHFYSRLVLNTLFFVVCLCFSWSLFLATLFLRSPLQIFFLSISLQKQHWPSSTEIKPGCFQISPKI